MKQLALSDAKRSSAFTKNTKNKTKSVEEPAGEARWLDGI